MEIEKNSVVSLHYTLRADTAEGTLIEETFGADPLVFLYGAGQMIPEFERQLLGKKAGENFSFGISSAEAYGEFDPDSVVMLPISTFVINGKLAEDLLQPGNMIPMSDEHGNRLRAIIREVRPDGVVVDFNHPMAGQDLYFTGVIESVRAATQSEVAHGHVHGTGGHHH
jgi:FKBP-type peptidyl-prolyl cis-trans isomerase SlyD